MSRQQILVVVASIAAVVLIYQLPRVVVENETTAEVKSHDFSISDEDQLAFASLRQQLKASEDIKKSINFADSLAQLYLKYQMSDSAAKYAAYLQTDSSVAAQEAAAMIYYRAFEMASQPQEAQRLAGQAGEVFRNLLETDPTNSSWKNKLAMTLMTTEAPMAGVQLLREVLAENPENREAILNLGLLAIRSGQYDRATERFDRLLALDSSDYEALFYLGVAHAESGNNEAAKDVFEQLMSKQDADPALKATASNYMKDF